MVEYPNFDKRERYGSSGDWTAPVAARFASIPEDVVVEDREVFLQYKARRLRVRVTRVMYQNEYEGCVLGFEGVPPVVEMDGLQAGSMVASTMNKSGDSRIRAARLPTHSGTTRAYLATGPT